jgi:undecaprenyl-diphosphatase
MSPTTGFLLGLVQGLTEFLPVSSSGHLLLAEHFLNVERSSPFFDIVLHLATFLATVVALRTELVRILAFLASTMGIRWVSLRSDELREGRRLFLALVIGTIPAAVAGFLFRDALTVLVDSPRFVGFAMLVTGVVLVATRLAPNGTAQLDATSALAIGFAQALALLPGVSRSGMTVSAGLFAGVRRERVVRFSFLLSLPAVLAAAILKLRQGDVVMGGIPPLTLVIAFVTALVSGFLALNLMVRVVVSGKLTFFGIYCIAVGVAALVFLPAARP